MNHGRHARLGMTLMVPGGPLWRWRAAGLAAQEKRGENHWGPWDVGLGRREMAHVSMCPAGAGVRCREQEHDDAAYHLPGILVDRSPTTPLRRRVIPVNAIARLLLDFVLTAHNDTL
jgi:hypothetical protein